MRSDLFLRVDLPRDPIQSTIIVSRLLEKLKLARQLLESSAIIDGDKDSDDDDDDDDEGDDDDEEGNLEASVDEGELFFKPDCRLLLPRISVRIHLQTIIIVIMMTRFQTRPMLIDANNDISFLLVGFSIISSLIEMKTVRELY